MRWLTKFFPGCVSQDLAYSIEDLVLEMENLKIQLKLLECSVKDLEKIVAERSDFFDVKVSGMEKVVESLSQDMHKYKPILSPPQTRVKTSGSKPVKILKRGKA